MARSVACILQVVALLTLLSGCKEQQLKTIPPRQPGTPIKLHQLSCCPLSQEKIVKNFSLLEREVNDLRKEIEELRALASRRQ